MAAVEVGAIERAFPGIKPESPEHGRIVAKIKQYMKLERAAPGNWSWQATRNLALNPMPGLDIRTEAKNIYHKERRPVKVFEVGCGRGHSLRTLKAFMGSAVHIDGITLTKHAANHAAGKYDGEGPTILSTEGMFPIGGTLVGDIPKVKVRTGLIEGENLSGQDFIFSFQSMRYVIDQARALERIANGLANGGKAILHVPKSFLGRDKQRVRNYLERNGIAFKLKRARSKLRLPGEGKRTMSAINLIVLQRKSDKPVDLSPFYRIRTNDFWQDANPRQRKR